MVKLCVYLQPYNYVHLFAYGLKAGFVFKTLTIFLKIEA